MDAEKRRRSSNFTQSDKITLINVVAEFKHVIENKKTDSVTSKEKNETWKKITQIYNSSGPSCPRDVDTLKRMYENKKKMLRKSMAVERREFYKTGGGLPDSKIKTDPCDDLLLSIISSKSVSGMHHNFGGDALQISSTDAAQIFSADAAQSSSVDVAQTSTSLSAQDFTQCAKEDIESQMEFVFEDDDDELNVGGQSIVECEVITPEDQENSPCTSKKWTNYKIPDLRAKKSPALAANNLTRRRPRTVVRHLTTSSVSEKYDKLLDERLELAAFQKEHLRNLIQRENEEHKLKMELLRVQIKKENIMLEKTNRQ